VESFVGGDKADEHVAQMGEELSHAFVGGFAHQVGFGEFSQRRVDGKVCFFKGGEQLRFRRILAGFGDWLAAGVKKIGPVRRDFNRKLQCIFQPEARHGEVAENPGGVIHAGSRLPDHLLIRQIGHKFMGECEIETIRGQNVVDRGHGSSSRRRPFDRVPKSRLDANGCGILFAMSETPILSLRGIHFSRNGRAILTGIDWEVRRGEIAAVLGPNGCGKSTLLRIASGYLWPQRGNVQLLGQTFGEVPIAPLRARVGIVEATAVYPFDEIMTTRDVVTSGYFSSLTLGYVHPTANQFSHADQLLEQVGLPTQAKQLYATLSTGERLRCLLARALVRRPDLLLLDEPTAGLDLPAREALLATLARLHREAAAGAKSGGIAPAIVTITHHLEELLPQTANVMLLSRAGEVIAAGSPESVITDGHLSAAYQVPIHVTHRNRRFHAHVDPATWDELL
jgi:iron complex transport system ATP-binding protein